MKKKYIYFILIAALFVGVCLLFKYSDVLKTKFVVESAKKSETLESNHNHREQKLRGMNNGSEANEGDRLQATHDPENQYKNGGGSEHFLLQGLSKLAFDISRELCVQEQKLLIETLEPRDAKRRPSVNEVISLLKKTANSKCSSFRRNNAQELFFKFKLDENNYKSFLTNFSLLLGDYQGMLPLKLMRASIQELKHAKPEEIRPLRDAMIYSLSTTINDSSAFIDVGVSIAMLKELSQKGLIFGPTLPEIEAIEGEFKEEMQRQIKISNSTRQEHDYPIDKMGEYLDYEDAKIELKLMQDEYQAVELFRDKLIRFMERSSN